MMRSAHSSSRLWFGPIMLIIIIALIYLLSLMPASPPMGSNGLIMADPHPEYSIKGQPHNPHENEIIDLTKTEEDDECLPNGYTNSTEGGCRCRNGYSGSKCEIVSCLNNGTYNQTLEKCECVPPFYGKTCSIRCPGNFDEDTGICECPPGIMCAKRCINGQLIDNSCVCYAGYTGPACTTCKSPTGCDDITRRRGAVNSRLTLSGLSFCIITIGLLCVGARRRRSQMAPMSDETWYRVFHPNNNRPFRCRHDYMCGGSWVPRDRALIVAPGRVSMSTAPRIHRLATPPPSYTSVDDAGDLQTLPPTYEEATRIEVVNEEQENVEQVGEEQKETTSDEQIEIRVEEEEEAKEE